MGSASRTQFARWVSPQSVLVVVASIHLTLTLVCAGAVGGEEVGI